MVYMIPSHAQNGETGGDWCSSEVIGAYLEIDMIFCKGGGLYECFLALKFEMMHNSSKIKTKVE